MPIKKRKGVCSLFVPVFFKNKKDIGAEVVIPFSDIAYGQALYGDRAKADGARQALEQAKAKGQEMRLVEIAVNIDQSASPIRATRSEVEAGLSFLSLPKVKVEFKEEIDYLIENSIKAEKPSARIKDVGDYLIRNPEAGRCVFDEFKGLDMFVIESQPPYCEKPLTVALLRNKKSIIEASIAFDERVKVVIK